MENNTKNAESSYICHSERSEESKKICHCENCKAIRGNPQTIRTIPKIPSLAEGVRGWVVFVIARRFDRIAEAIHKNLQRTNLQFLKTKDGSFSAYNEQYKDFYHSTKDGAILETLYKHIIPTFALIESNADSTAESSANSAINSTRQNPIKVLDICFGLGYNALFTLAFAKRLNIALSVYSMELHLLDSLREFAYPKILFHYLPVREILESLFLRGAWEYENLKIHLYKGDAKDYLKHLVRENHAFDIIYQDAFSPSKNAELWDKSHFQNLYALLKNNGAISTYSSSHKVREICQNIGFKVYNIRCGNLKNGTILRKNAHTIAQINFISFNKI